MKLNKEQIEYYRENGLLFIPQLLSTKEVEAMHAAVEDLIVRDIPGRFRLCPFLSRIGTQHFSLRSQAPNYHL